MNHFNKTCVLKILFSVKKNSSRQTCPALIINYPEMMDARAENEIGILNEGRCCKETRNEYDEGDIGEHKRKMVVQ